MTVRCILRNKISFIGQVGYNYIYIKIEGKGIIVNEISRTEARNTIEENNLHKASPEEYSIYNSSYGDVYVDDNFVNYVNKDPILKQSLYSILDQIENE